MLKSIFVAFLLCYTTLVALAGGEASPYVPPVDFAISLSANYGEVRTTHFHAGIDIKTGGVTGKNILSVADGYISRISVSPVGYGKALYITHPKLGSVTVYGHLIKYAPKIEKYIEAYQYRNKTFSANIYLDEGTIPVKQGEVVALSGNSGSSGGPHLHFEIRNAKTGLVYDPLKVCKYPVLDHIPPQIISVGAVEIDESYGNPVHIQSPRHETKRLSQGKYILPKDTIFISRNAYLAFEVTETKDNTTNIYGVRKMSLTSKGIEVWSYDITSLSYSFGRAVSSFALYPETSRTRHDIIRTYIDPVNKLTIYKGKINRGIIKYSQLEEPLNYTLKISDEFDNSSTVSFVVARSSSTPQPIAEPLGDPVSPEKFYTYKDSVFNFVLPPYALQQAGYMKIERYNEARFPNSDIVSIGDKEMPFTKSATLSIRPSAAALSSDTSKLGIGQLSSDGRVYSCSGSFKNGYVTTEIGYVGKYVVISDTTPPTILPAWSAKYPIKSQISFKVSDNLSGIAKYDCYIDDKWALFEYDLKTDRIFHYLDSSKTTKGIEHTVKVVAIDGKGNKKSYTTKFKWQ